MTSRTQAILFGALVLGIGFSSTLNSQTAADAQEKAILDRIQKIEDRQELLLEQQQKTLKALEVLAESARQTRIFAARS